MWEPFIPTGPLFSGSDDSISLDDSGVLLSVLDDSKTLETGVFWLDAGTVGGVPQADRKTDMTNINAKSFFMVKTSFTTSYHV